MPCIKLHNTDDSKSGNIILWHKINKLNDECFKLQNNNSMIVCKKPMSIKITVQLYFETAIRCKVVVEVNGKQQAVFYPVNNYQNYKSWEATTVILDINANDYITITDNREDYRKTYNNSTSGQYVSITESVLVIEILTEK